MAKVSILVPVYNVKEYLRECLDSILRQTLQDIEILCLDDGSTDGSSEILDEYASSDSRIRVIHKENSGYGASMNVGLQQARGEYIGIVESDDFVKDVMFEDLYNLAKKFDSDMVKSEFYEYTGKNNISRKTNMFSRMKRERVIDIKENTKLLRAMPSIWSAIYRREFLINNNIKFLETPGASFQDTSFAFKTLACAKNLVLTSQAYLYYRQDNENSSVKSKQKVYAICDEYEEITKFLDTNPQIKSFANSAKLIKQYSTYLWNLRRIDKDFREEFCEKFAQTFKLYYDRGEIKKEFYKKHNKSLFDSLLSDKAEFKIFLDKLNIRNEKKRNRRKNFSLRISKSGIDLVILGKQIAGIK